MVLPKGAGPKVVEVAKNISHTFGIECLKKIAKMHFKTTRVITEND